MQERLIYWLKGGDPYSGRRRSDHFELKLRKKRRPVYTGAIENFLCAQRHLERGQLFGAGRQEFDLRNKGLSECGLHPHLPQSQSVQRRRA
jgi:hypothetical protein